MESDSWSDRLSAALKHSEAALQSYSDLYMELEDIDGEEDTRGWFPCPFCSEAEDFDIIGICRHIDDEHFGMKNGVCPVCAMRVGMDMVAHITMQHGHLFKVQRKRRFCKGSHSTLSLLRKELREGNLNFLRESSSFVVSSSNTASDPLLASLIYNLPIGDESECVQPHSSAEVSSVKKISEEDVVERSVQSSPPLSDKEQEEMARRCKFVDGLLLSTILDDDL